MANGCRFVRIQTLTALRQTGLGGSRGDRRTAEAADKNRGVPQGGPLSPLPANLSFRRFILAWKRFGHGHRLAARVVN